MRGSWRRIAMTLFLLYKDGIGTWQYPARQELIDILKAFGKTPEEYVKSRSKLSATSEAGVFATPTDAVS
jgi:hypothetical protein